ncbi:hypothetical protein [Prosthecobacter sp.]|uniref:hypothetical protein n=1 Tax=Prosthecobacter sp. TaxID=1965333 RepID=UPI00378319D3
MIPACFRLVLIGLIFLGCIQPSAKAEPKSKAQEAPALLTREFKVPLDFLVSTVGEKDKQNPFERKTAKEVLEAWGLPFPAGASASLNLANGLLIVRNTQENMELVSALLNEATQKAPRSITFQVMVLEGPGKVIREANAAAASKSSAVKELQALLSQAEQARSGIKVIGDTWLEAHSGTRSVTETAREHIYSSQVRLDDKSRSSLELEMRQIGLRLELEPILGADSRLIDLTTRLEFFPAQPNPRQLHLSDPMSGNAVEFPVSDAVNVNFTTAFLMMGGDTKILGIARPAGKMNAAGEDVLWIAFLTGHVAPVPVVNMSPLSPEPSPQATSTKPSKQLIPITCGVGMFDLTRPLTSIFTLHTVQAPAPFIRALAAKAASTSDHAAVWKEIETAAARGEAAFIDSHLLESQSGVKAEISASREWSYPASFKTDTRGRPEITFEMRPAGSRLSLEPVIRHDALSIGVTLDYELHTAPPHSHREVFLDPGSRQKFEMPLVDFHTAHVQTCLTLAHGGTRLLTFWQPASHDGADVLWATFLHGEVLRQTAPEKTTPATEIKSTAPPDENEWISQVFSVPSDIASGSKTAPQLLEEAGIPLPRGAKAYFNSAANKLIVRTQRKHMDLVEAFVDPNPPPYPQTVVFTTHVIQAPGPVIRRAMGQIAGHCDHRPEMNQLLASAEIKHLATSRIETKRGVNATSEEVIEHIALAALESDEKGGLTIKRDMRKVGFLMSLEPMVLTDGSTIAATLAPEFHTADPQENLEQITDTQGRKLEFPLTHYHAAKISTSIMMPSGTARLIGVWKPTGKPEFEASDILQAAFITADYLR